MITITKKFDFCYGHRVHNQKLDSKFSLNNRLVCRHRHGHQGEVIITIASDRLDGDMVTDFKHLNWFKKWIDDTLDHKFIYDINDPLLKYDCPKFVPILNNDCLDYDANGFWKASESFLGTLLSGERCLFEAYEGVVLVDFVPTSENLCSWLFGIISPLVDQMPGNCYLKSVEFKETPKTSAKIEI